MTNRQYPPITLSSRVFPIIIISFLTMALVFSGSVGPVRASPADVVLDANSVSTSDILVQMSESFTRQFAVGIVITGVTPTDFIDNLVAFQFVLSFDATKLTAQGTPPAVGLPNTPTVQFGTLAPHNWQGFIDTFAAAGIVIVNSTTVVVGYTLFFDPIDNPPRDITAPTILARVNFEIDTTVASPGAAITLSNVILVNDLLQAITETTGGNPISTGGPVSEVVTNSPPIASFTFAPVNPVVPDASGTTMVTFDAAASSDSDGTIATYAWDFGDGNGEQDLGAGPFMYGLVGLGKFNVTLRVVDNSGATGAARDAFGSVIVDDQPSHTFQTVVIDTPPVLSPIGGQTVDEEVQLSFTATATDVELAETVAYDSDADGLYDVGEPVIFGTTPPSGRALKDDPRIKYVEPTLQSDQLIKYVDANNNNIWNSGEVVVYDTDGDFAYDTDEPVISGTTPSPGTVLKLDAKVRFVDLNQSLIRDIGEPVAYDSNFNNLFDLGDIVIFGTISGNNVWDLGETVVYDVNSDGLYSSGEPVLAGSIPSVDTSLMDDPRIKYVDSDNDNVRDAGAGQTLFFSLSNAPVGASIDPETGEFGWTPSEAQGPGAFTFDVRVTDSIDVFDSETITVTVSEVNKPPLLGAIGNRNVNEEASLSFIVTATDPDIPANTLTLSATGLPSGATFNPATGQFSWTPTEAQGPGTFTLTFTATDNGTPPLSDPETITVTVAEVNKSPVLSVPSAQTVTAGSLLTFTITATDPDTPANTVAITVSGLPTGATFDPATGVFSWTPSAAGDFTVTFSATDNGSPAMSETRTVSVQVSEAPSVVSLPIIAGGIAGVIILLFLLWQFVLKKRGALPASPSPPTKSLESDWRLPERGYSMLRRFSAVRQSRFFSRVFLTRT